MSFDFTTIILILFMLMSLQPLVPARTLLTAGASSQTARANCSCFARSAGSGSSVVPGRRRQSDCPSDPHQQVPKRRRNDTAAATPSGPAA